MTPQELKNSILQLAIQGKLVEQRPEEGSGAELYKQIQAEKQALIKAGKIKKEKALPAITEDDVIFDIPESWMWCYIGDLFQHNTGKALNGSDKSGTPMTYITTSNLYWDRFELDKLKEMPFTENEVEKCIVQKGDLLVCEGGDFGRSAIWPYDYPMRIQNHIHRLRAYGSVATRYFYYIFYLYKNAGLIAGKGIAIQGLSSNALHALKVPLPPLDEQKRIVAKIEELMPLIDCYEQAWSKLEDFNKRFPGDMQKSILQMAIQGKLVPQDVSEGTGDELYRQIQAEKQTLIKAGKIKKEKPLPEIAEDEIPFEIPENWKWVHFSDIAIFENGDRSSKYPVEADYVDFGIPFFGAKDMDGKYMSFADTRYISKEKYDELGNGKLQDKDFICLLRGSVGKCAIFRSDDKHNTGFICAQMIIIRLVNKQLCDYVYSYLSSPFYAGEIESRVTGTAVRQLPGKELSKFLVPLPPLAEQKRIVAKLEELLPLCERLKS